MQKIKVSAVSYLNSLPFIYGINHSDVINLIELSLDIPAVCADKLVNDKVDIGLIPVAEIFASDKFHIISDYCISAKGIVNSVILCSEVPLKEIKTILLDYQSRTSVQLTKILSAGHWHIQPDFKNGYDGYEKDISGTTAGLVIGDRALRIKNNFRYAFDLSEAWYEMTSLPFVFACWVSNKKLNEHFIKQFNAALKYGTEQIEEVIAEVRNPEIPIEEMRHYLKKNINYLLDNEKKKGMELFFKFLKKGKRKEFESLH